MRPTIKVLAVVALVFIAAAAAAFASLSPTHVALSYMRDAGDAAASSSSVEYLPPEPLVQHVVQPSPLKGIYMTQCVVGTPSFRDSLVKFIEDTELNAVVIDIKDFSGGLAFHSEDPMLKDFVSKKCGAYDMKEFIETLHDKGIYVIGRITVFQDPLYADTHPTLAVQKEGGGVWRDHKKLAFIDVGAKPFWDYIIRITKVAYEEFGFDELNYDYIRFPSDGPMAQAVYSHSLGKSKEQALEEFFRYLHAHVQGASSTIKVFPGQPAPVMSADLFGYTTVHTDDLGIGQILERAMPYFDHIMPMVYPSHYNKGFAGLQNVNSDPGKIVYVSMADAVRRTVATTTVNYSFVATPIASASTSSPQATSPQMYEKPSYPASKMRPWLQSFDYPVPYTPEMVQAQIEANEKSGLDSYVFWDAANKYWALRKVLAQ